MGLVPQPDRRLCQIVLVPEDAKARRAEQEVTARGRCETQPTSGQYPRDMRARKYRNIAVERAYSLNDAVGPCSHLLRSFASWAAVAEQEPARSLRQDVGGAAALVLAVIPFGEIGVGFGKTAEPGQLGGPPRPL